MGGGDIDQKSRGDLCLTKVSGLVMSHSTIRVLLCFGAFQNRSGVKSGMMVRLA